MVSIVNNGATIDIVNYRQTGTTATIVKANVKQVLVVGGNVIIKETKNNGTATYEIIPSTVTSPTTYANGNILQAYISSILNQSVTGVLSFSAGTTGLTPNVATQGNITLGGVLNETHGGTNQSSYAIGDLLYATAVDTLGKLPVGLNGEVLTLSAGVPVWAAAGGVTNVTATSPITSSGGATPDISTSMATSRLIGRTTAGVGVMEEISIGAGLSLAAGVLSATAASVALSAITAATATNTIDNLDYAQTWNWSTLNTQTAFSYNANALTTGTILSLATSNATTLNSTNGLLYVANTGGLTTGIIARFQSNLTAESGLTVTAAGTVGIGETTPLGQLHIAGAFPSKGGLILNGTNLTNNNGTFAAWQSSGTDLGYIYVNDSGSDTYRGIKISNPTASSEIFVAKGGRGITITNNGSFTTANAFSTTVTALLGTTTPLTVFGADVSTAGQSSLINHIHNTNTASRTSMLLHRFFTSTSAIVEYGGYGTELMVNTNGAHSGDLFFRTALTGTFAERMRLKASGSLLIGTTTEAASSILTMESTEKGFLPPRMTTAQKNAIGTPVEGLVLFDTDLNKLCVYSGAAWETVTSV